MRWQHVIAVLLSAAVGCLGMIAWLCWTYAGRRERELARWAGAREALEDAIRRDHAAMRRAAGLEDEN
jgi:hypothetical protein